MEDLVHHTEKARVFFSSESGSLKDFKAREATESGSLKDFKAREATISSQFFCFTNECKRPVRLLLLNLRQEAIGPESVQDRGPGEEEGMD